ncbi:DUF742 domain-containing protein [Cellulomonas triticagri]|uniref:DUF742 domain-containing protein n=1 Tax=Cellulomonas triticagri TaxID=2483352 RepID=A0A3M2JRI3_9CELL|nr:DUF742 domain-containing protein [Cellulomonas triticagri]RMI12838.1 DUF742 domain-containing protein [Cellulomonas triticagri]
MDERLGMRAENVPSTIRPYVITRGKLEPEKRTVPLEALVERLPGAAPVGLTTESTALLHLLAGTGDAGLPTYLSLAELSAHLRLPVVVVRVLVSDLVQGGLLRVHGVGDPAARQDKNETLRLLESVLHGIASY